LNWLIATAVAFIDETPRVRSIVLDCPGWPGHRPGQHLDLRLTAEDGYQAQRSYSIATPADGDRLTITVEQVDEGEVSGYLLDGLGVGDRIEVKGPIGGYFVWTPDRGGPLQLLGGGSGVVPLMAMLRARVATGSDVPVRYLASSRSYDDIIYRDELDTLARDDPGISVVHTLTRSQPPGWKGPSRRVDEAMLDELAWPAGDDPLCCVCGPTGFVETVATSLVKLGHRPERVLTERFGPSGGAT
jgi:ferredoxin-NADP reductase